MLLEMLACFLICWEIAEIRVYCYCLDSPHLWKTPNEAQLVKLLYVVYTYNKRQPTQHIAIKVHSFLKQCCARSLFEQNKILQLMSAEEGFLQVPFLCKCFKN